MTKEGFSANIVLTKQRGATMDYHNLHNIIDTQEDKIYKLEKKIDSLEKDRDNLLKGYQVLLSYITSQDDKIMALNEKWVEIHSKKGE